MRQGWSEADLVAAKQRMGQGEAARKDVRAGMASRPVGDLRAPSRGGNCEPVSSPALSPYKSKWEATFAGKLDLEKQAGVIKGWKYEGVTFTLSKGQYHRIDFLIWHNDCSIELAQVKGWHPNMRAAIKGLKWAAQLHPWFTWTIKRWTGTGWDSNYVDI